MQSSTRSLITRVELEPGDAGAPFSINPQLTPKDPYNDDGHLIMTVSWLFSQTCFVESWYTNCPTARNDAFPAFDANNSTQQSGKLRTRSNANVVENSSTKKPRIGNCNSDSVCWSDTMTTHILSSLKANRKAVRLLS